MMYFASPIIWDLGVSRLYHGGVTWQGAFVQFSHEFNIISSIKRQCYFYKSAEFAIALPIFINIRMLRSLSPLKINPGAWRVTPVREINGLLYHFCRRTNR
jgi:hypothetical protein